MILLCDKYGVAERYYSGKNGKRNLSKYMYWLKCSAESGYCDAVFKFGKELYDGISCEKNEAEGLKLISQAALDDNLNAVCFLVCNMKGMYLNIIGEEELLEKIEASRERMTASQLMELAVLFRDNGDIYNAMNFAKKAYEADSKMAWEMYVSLLQMQETVENKALALKILREMATNGDCKAAKILGHQYENNAKTENDIMTAIYWYRIASYIGSDIAHSKVSYKSKECIVQDLTVVFEDDLKVVCKVKGKIAFQGKDYLIISDYETQEEFVLHYMENHSLKGFDIEGVDEETEEVVLRLYGGKRRSAS